MCTNFRVAVCNKYLKNNKHNTLHLTEKIFRIFVLGHYLIFALNGGYCFCMKRKKSEISCTPLD